MGSMPIMYVNGPRRGMRIRGRAVVGNPARRRNRRSRAVAHDKGPAAFAAYDRRKAKRKARVGTRKRRQPAALARYWAARRRKAPSKRRRAAPRGYYMRRGPVVDGAYFLRKVRKPSRKRGRRARRSTPVMAKRRRKRRARVHHTVRRRRRRSRHVAAPKRRRRRRRKAVAAAPKRRRRRRRSHAVAPKRRRRRRRAAAAPRRRRRKRSRGRHGTRRMRRGSMKRRAVGTLRVLPSGTATVKYNPSRRRRRRRRSTTRRYHRRGRVHSRRYRRGRYRRNPGGMLIDLAKRAIPVALGFIGANVLINRVGPMLPGVSALGSLQQPALAIGEVVLANYLTKKVGVLAKHREEIMLGAGLSMLTTLFKAFAPASVQSMIGMSDYVQMGDYVAVGGAPPLREDFSLSDYVAVGGDGLEEELGLTEELGVV